MNPFVRMKYQRRIFQEQKIRIRRNQEKLSIAQINNYMIQQKRIHQTHNLQSLDFFDVKRLVHNFLKARDKKLKIKHIDILLMIHRLSLGIFRSIKKISIIALRKISLQLENDQINLILFQYRFIIFIKIIEKNHQKESTMSEVKQVQQVQMEDVQKFVRSRVNHSYNKEVFEEELNDQIKKNLVKMQESIIKDLKRKMIVKNQQQLQLQKRQNIKKELDEKLRQSKQKRDRQKQKKLKQMAQQHKFKQELVLDRLSQIKKKQMEEVNEKLKEFQNKQKSQQRPKYNKIDRAISLIQEPHYKRKLDLDQARYNKLRSFVQDKKSVFKDTKLTKRQLSLTELQPRETIYQSKQKQRINKMGEHLEKIDQIRKKREKLISEKVKTIHYSQKDATQLKNERLKVILEAQRKRQQNIISRLSKSSMSTSNLLKNNTSSASNTSKIQPQSSSPNLKGSIIYEQSQQRQKHTYRKQIKEQIRQYMLKQKQKIINQQA